MKENKKNSELENLPTQTRSGPEEIIYTLDDIMSERFARYAKYIIQERALPDARDGLKPVQRRILYAMDKLNLTFNSSYKKSARTVGEVLGKFHPHGDTSVYDAMVRLSQTWKVKYPLIDMHGNNGSIDGDSQAAMRYTEARLSELSSYLLQDIDKETVPFAPNFDDSEVEPVVLPAMFPNLLVNGATGIAAGYATNIPPHNLCEVIDATIYRIKHPKCKIEELFKIIHGPDFPTGGIIQGIDGIHEAYRTGKGRIIIRSKIIEENEKLLITEIPYEVVKQDLVKKIDDVKYDQPGLNIREVRDETDRVGLCIAIELNKGANIDVVRKYLLKNTNLQVSYSFNLVSIIDKQPKQTGLLTLLDAYIAHQQDVITRRSKYDLNKTLNRLEVVDGLIKAIGILDEIIAIIRHSKDKSDAVANLIARFEFTNLQAEAIVQLRLYRLTSTDINLLMKEKDELYKLAEELKGILGDFNVLNKTIIQQLLLIKSKFGDERRSFIEDEIETIEIEKVETVVEKNVKIWVSRDGYLKSFDEYQWSKLNSAEFKRKPNDIYLDEITTSSTNSLLMFTSKGNYVIVPVYKIKQSKARDIGEHVNTIAHLPGNEKIIACFVIDSFNKPECYIFMATRLGYLKKTLLKEFEATRISKAMTAMKLKSEDDELICAQVMRNEDCVVFVSKQGFVVKYSVNDIDELGTKAVGLKSMNLRDEDAVIGAGLCHGQRDSLIMFSDNDAVKKIGLTNIETSERPAKGFNILNNTRKAIAHIIFAFVITPDKSNLSYVNKNDEISLFYTREVNTTQIDTAFGAFDMKLITDMVLPNHYDLCSLPNGSDEKPEILVHNELPKNLDSKNHVKDVAMQSEKQLKDKAINNHSAHSVKKNDLLEAKGKDDLAFKKKVAVEEKELVSQKHAIAGLALVDANGSISELDDDGNFKSNDDSSVAMELNDDKEDLMEAKSDNHDHNESIKNLGANVLNTLELVGTNGKVEIIGENNVLEKTLKAKNDSTINDDIAFEDKIEIVKKNEMKQSRPINDKPSACDEFRVVDKKTGKITGSYDKPETAAKQSLNNVDAKKQEKPIKDLFGNDFDIHQVDDLLESINYESNNSTSKVLDKKQNNKEIKPVIGKESNQDNQPQQPSLFDDDNQTDKSDKSSQGLSPQKKALFDKIEKNNKEE